MARLIRTEKEVEGRYSEQWIVVEEDALEQWPEGPLATVGRSALRQDGHARARGEATLHRRPPAPGHAARRDPAQPVRQREGDAARPERRARGAVGARRDRARRTATC